MHRFTGILGMLTVMAVAYAFSTNRRAIRYKTVDWGLGLQIAFAFLVMRSDYGRLAFEKLGAGANWIWTSPTTARHLSSAISARKIPLAAFISRFRPCQPSSSSPLYSRSFIISASCSSL